MSNPRKIVIIGGTACGPKAAARARRCDPHARITIIEQQDDLSTATCGLPYYISGVIDNEDNMVARRPDYFEMTLDMEVMTGTRAIKIDSRAHTVRVGDIETDKQDTLRYDKLVIATGSEPVKPRWDGIDLKGIFTLSTIPDANAIREYISTVKSREAVVVGAGLIGMEMAEAFIEMGLKVTVVEAFDRVLPQLLDTEIAAHVAKHLKSKGADVLCSSRVTGLTGDDKGRVSGVVTEGGEISAGLVVLSLGVRPNTSLAKDAGLDIGETGGITVDEHLRTIDPDIYAGGDCVEVVNRLTGSKMLAPMGSTANRHGRVIGTNVTGGNDAFPGVLGTAIVKVFDYNVGRTGLNEAQAQEAGYDTVISIVTSPEHASYYPGDREILVKLVADKANGKLLGGQVIGTGEAAKRIDVLATALSFGATVDDLAELDLSYAPPYNSALDPLHNAANVIRNKRSGLAKAAAMRETWEKLENGDDFVLLDVRSSLEYQETRIESDRVRLIPLTELRRKLEELSPDDEIIIYCRTSVRAYQAQRILDGAGFRNVRFMDGSLTAWPYEFYESPD